MSNGNKGATTVVAILITLAIAGTGGFFVGQRNGQQSAKLETAVVATVNNEDITQADLYKRMVSAVGPKVVDDLIRNKLVKQEAKAQNVTVTPADIDAEVAKIREEMGGESQLQAALTQNNVSMEELREFQELRLIARKILGKDIAVDDAALQKYFEENKARFDTREVHARHILVNTEQEAKDIKAQLDNNADFATLAKEKSTEPAAKQSGGDLGTFKPGQMVPQFDEVVFTLKKGEISQPFQTQFGWHVAQVLETKGAAPDFAALKDKVKDAYIEDQVNEKLAPWLDGLKAKAKISNTLETKNQ